MKSGSEYIRHSMSESILSKLQTVESAGGLYLGKFHHTLVKV